MLSLYSGDSVSNGPQGSLRTNPTDFFKILDFKCLCLQELTKFRSSSFQSQMLWGDLSSLRVSQYDSLFLSPFTSPQCPSLSSVYSPKQFSSLTVSHPFPSSSMAYSLSLVLEFFLPVFGSFFRLFTLI